jgi:hypothetical protein
MGPPGNEVVPSRWQATYSSRDARLADVSQSALERVRAIALSLPDVSERLSHGEPCFFVRKKRPICYFHDDHNGDGRIAAWCPASPGAQDELVAADPQRFFRPQPSAGGVFADWIGVFLDRPPPSQATWDELAEIIEDAYRFVAPKSLVRLLESR